MNKIQCDRQDCLRPPVGALGMLAYPPKAVMDHYHTDEPLSRVITGLELCQEHIDEFDPQEVFGEEQLDNIARVLEVSGTACDRKAFKPVAVPFDDPEYVALMAGKRSPVEAPERSS